MKNRSIDTGQEAQSSAGKRRTRKLASVKKRGNRSKNQILDRVSIFDDLDDYITNEHALVNETNTILGFTDSATVSQPPLPEISLSHGEPLQTPTEEPESLAATLAFPTGKTTPAKDSEKIQRRRQIDPTTCERDYSDDEIEFMNALDTYKRNSGRMFPTCSEILEVLLSLGYRKTGQGEAAEPEAEKPQEQLPPSTPTFVSCDDYREPLAIF
ncbi:MAG: hypothetical protein PHQ75_03255 [Thermoguttaceae bacterium]|nr:hypothetical protein [Thermoguttaceae bacterium]